MDASRKYLKQLKSDGRDHLEVVKIMSDFFLLLQLLIVVSLPTRHCRLGYLYPPPPRVPAIAVHTVTDTWNRVSRLSNTHPGRGQGQPTRQCSTVNQLSHFTLTSPSTSQSACTTRFTCRNAKCAFITFFLPSSSYCCPDLDRRLV